MELAALLGIRPGVTVVIGGGGKTTLLRTLGGELAAVGARVLLCTTTKILPFPDLPCAVTAAELERLGRQHRLLCAGTPVPGTGKLTTPEVPIGELVRRFDYVLADPDDTFFRELVQYHISGQLKVAPEHVSDQVLHYMGKPEHAVFMQFTEKYKKLNEKYGMNQFLVPYLMSSHPGCTMKEAVKLAEYLRDLGYMPEQVQDFYPTPSTISTCMYYTGLDPRTMEQVYVPTNPHEKAMQRALIQYRNPKNYDLVKEALIKAHRTDLIGYDKHCLIRPEKPSERPAKAASGSSGKRTGGKQQGGGDFRGAKGKNSSGAKGHRSSIRNTQKKKGK